MFKKMVILLTVLILLTIGCAGCPGYSAWCRSSGYPIEQLRLYNIEIGMAKGKVIENLGEPYNVIGSKTFESGIVEVWEYRRYEPGSWVLKETYWVYFLNDKLAQWGRPGDWKSEADRIYELRMR